MPHNEKNNRRCSLRLPDYDYTQPGAYFVTICTYEKKSLFGKVVNGEMILNEVGQVAHQEWLRLNIRFRHMDFSTFVVMPNHVHGIIYISADMNHKGLGDPAPFAGPLCSNSKFQVLPGSLGAVVRAYKASVTWRIRAIGLTNQAHIWQRNYYEHVIRNEQDFQTICDYIETNPQKWQQDRFFNHF
jgi:REP element-mobilizing transposase RayT